MERRGVGVVRASAADEESSSSPSGRRRLSPIWRSANGLVAGEALLMVRLLLEEDDTLDRVEVELLTAAEAS